MLSSKGNSSDKPDTEIESPRTMTDQKISFCPALNFFAGGCPFEKMPPPLRSQLMSLRCGIFSATHMTKIIPSANINAQDTLLCTHLEPTAINENASCPKVGIKNLRPKSEISPVKPKRIKDPESNQWPKRSIALKRVILRPVFSPSILMRPRYMKKAASRAIMPIKSAPPYVASGPERNFNQLMPPSWIKTVAAGPVLEAVVSAEPKRRARQSSGSEFPPKVPSWFVISAAWLASPVASLRKLLSTASPLWRAIISSRVCAPPVALRSGASALCALAVDRNDRVKIKAIKARNIWFPQRLLGEKGDPTRSPFLFTYSDS